uniref:Uncharacterized protein n=1 Tax=Amphimedon queenslandica TaxID=400682 RepID=A0A1X7V592_AMPQE
MDILRQLNAEILIGQLSFKQRADFYNFINNKDSKEGISQRQFVPRHWIDRRHLEEDFFQYALLRISSWYPKDIPLSALKLHGEFDDTLLAMAPVFHNAFQKHYSAHACTKPGCGKVLMLDGNMKNHRDVCLATQARYTKYDGLPGSIRTGCPNSPAYPPLVVVYYEKGLEYDIQDQLIISAGQKHHTLVPVFVFTSKSSKKERVDTIVQPKIGTLCDVSQDSSDIKCQTEKDRKEKLNIHSAGLWPCGIITLISELMGSESKSQVYGNVHGFLCNNDQAIEVICYDEAWHLMKYACNRASATPTATKTANYKFVVDRMHFRVFLSMCIALLYATFIH